MLCQENALTWSYCCCCDQHGVPNILQSDNGPQYASATFLESMAEWGFEHITCSPWYPASNGFAESNGKSSENSLHLGQIQWRGPAACITHFMQYTSRCTLSLSCSAVVSVQAEDKTTNTTWQYRPLCWGSPSKTDWESRPSQGQSWLMI